MPNCEHDVHPQELRHIPTEGFEPAAPHYRGGISDHYINSLTPVIVIQQEKWNFAPSTTIRRQHNRAQNHFRRTQSQASPTLPG